LGPNSDGGYLIPNDIEGITACFSPGIGLVSGFEMDCSNFGMDIFMADYSVDNPVLINNKFHFIKKFIGVISNEKYITMDEWVRQSLPEDSDSDLLLQMDIEGAEYDVFENMSYSLINRFRIIVMEFHSFNKLWEPSFFEKVSTVFSKILESHIVVHLHPNNTDPIYLKNLLGIPPLMEVAFLRKDRISQDIKYVSQFPHPLDYDNSEKETVILPRCWYK